MFSCRLYYNTGFDPVNVPATPAVLESAADKYADFGPMDIHQSDFQTAIKIRCPHGEDDVIGADYLRISGRFDSSMDNERTTYYSVIGYNMTSPDVAVLTVVQDSFLTAGGVDKITFMDGVTVRHHVSDDLFGEYDEEDPMLVPSEPLQLVHDGFKNQTDSNTSPPTPEYYVGCCGKTGIFFNYEGNDGSIMASQIKLFRSSLDLDLLGEVDSDDILANVETTLAKVTGQQSVMKMIADGINAIAQGAALPDDYDQPYISPPLAKGTHWYLFKGTVDPVDLSAVDLSNINGSSSPSGVLLGGAQLNGHYFLIGGENKHLGMPYTLGYNCFMKFDEPFIGLYGFGYGINPGSFTTPQEAIEKSIKAARALGLADQIMECYMVPAALINYYYHTANGGTYAKGVAEASGVFTAITTRGACYVKTGAGTINASGTYDMSRDTTHPYDFRYTTVANLRVLYGKYNRYVLMVPSTGSKTEANPEDLVPKGRLASAGAWPDRPDPFNKTVITPGKNEREDCYAPYICCVSDPRPNGRPYFNFIRRKDYSRGGFVNVYDGAVAGEIWKRTPILLTGPSGFVQKDIAYVMNRNYKDTLASPEYLQRLAIEQGRDLSGGMSISTGDAEVIRQVENPDLMEVNTVTQHSTAAGMAAATAVSVGQSAIRNGLAQIGDEINFQTGTGRYAIAKMNREMARSLEDSQYVLSNTYIEPEVKFIPTETLRDAVGNGVFYARYRLSDNDIQKFDKILTRYGYADQRPVQDSFMTNRQKFNYLKVAGARVKNDKTNGNEYATIDSKKRYRASQAMLNDISSMFETGIRIWHVAPNETDFNNNPIRTGGN